MLYNICYRGFFLSQGNRLKNFFAHPKIRRPKPCLLIFTSLVAFNDFHLLPFTQLTADLTLEWSGGSMFHPLSHIYAKTPFVALKQLQTTLWIVDALLFLFDCKQTWHPIWTQLSHWQTFMQNDEYTAFWYLQLLCYLTQLQFTIGQNECMECFGVFQYNCRNWMTWEFSIICACTIAFKVSIPPLNRCFWLSRVWITLMKPLLCSNRNFPSESNALSTHEI